MQPPSHSCIHVIHVIQMGIELIVLDVIPTFHVLPIELGALVDVLHDVLLVVMGVVHRGRREGGSGVRMPVGGRAGVGGLILTDAGRMTLQLPGPEVVVFSTAAPHVAGTVGAGFGGVLDGGVEVGGERGLLTAVVVRQLAVGWLSSEPRPLPGTMQNVKYYATCNNYVLGYKDCLLTT
jgi:hypothetical protein